MADDGMLLNFELPSDTFAPKLSFKGGNWKDRLIARKTAVWAQGKAQERARAKQAEQINPTTQHVTVDGGEARPAKKARTELSQQKSAPPAGEHGGRPGQNSRPSQHNTAQGFVSSLFTYNPSTVPTDVTQQPEDETPVTPSNAPLADGLESFTSLGMSTTIANHLVKKMNVTAPTAIQKKAIQQLCRHDADAFIQAQTGSGKTLAYLLPIVQRISQISKAMKASGQDFSRETGLLAIILAPTRELSKQIASVLETLLSCFPFIICGSVIGGEKKKSEKARLRKGLNILVATPGRLSDHLVHTEAIDVSRVRWLVLDEGDRLMELGFEQDIQKLVGTLNLRATKEQTTTIPGLPPRRTTILCSATIKADVDKLHNIALKQATSIAVDEEAGEGEVSRAFSAPAQLRQGYVVVPPKQRLVTLAALMKQTFRRKGSVMKAIAFLSCADSVDFHFETFTRSQKSETASAEESLPSAPSKSKRGSIPQGLTISEQRTSGRATAFGTAENEVDVFRLHGSLPQAIRTSTLKGFAQSTKPALLLCTDVASRGLDLPNVELVIEVDPAFSKEEHLHRVGRTARAGNDGRALIFLQPGCEEGYVQILKDTQPRSLTRQDADELLQKAFMSAKTEDVQSRTWQDYATDWQMDAERWLVDKPKHLEQAMRAYQSHVRAYATHIAAERNMFDMKQLHLGHLAKAFALREKPSSMKVPGMRPGNSSNKRSRKPAGKDASDDEDGARTDVNAEQEGRKKMQAMSRRMNGGASEFNLG